LNLKNEKNKDLFFIQNTSVPDKTSKKLKICIPSYLQSATIRGTCVKKKKSMREKIKKNKLGVGLVGVDGKKIIFSSLLRVFGDTVG
jgi:hypothetical protein